MAFVTLWVYGDLRCLLVVNAPDYLVRVVDGSAVLREQPVHSPDAAIALARTWEWEQPIARVQAVLTALQYAG